MSSDFVVRTFAPAQSQLVLSVGPKKLNFSKETT